MRSKSPSAFRTISEVAKKLETPQHVLRFWESKFTQLRPLKRGGGRRYYRPEDIALLEKIRHLLYFDGYTIKGAQNILKNDTNKTNSFKQEILQSQRSELNSIIIDLEEIKDLLS